MDAKSIAAHHAHTFTVREKSPIHLLACFWEVGGKMRTCWKPTQMQGRTCETLVNKWLGIVQTDIHPFIHSFIFSDTGQDHGGSGAYSANTGRDAGIHPG